MAREVRRTLGAFALDLPGFAWGSRWAWPGGVQTPWVWIRNRREQLVPAPAGLPGVRCGWRFTSDLHVTKVFPRLGAVLMRRALDDWPIVFASAPRAADGAAPEVTFVIGHRGRERLPHLLCTLDTIAGQEGARVECVVVEQDELSVLRGALPSWVRHVHTPLPEPGLPYCRAWAFNVGARHAIGAVLVLHDNDLLVPAHYARELARHARLGAEVLDLKRFIFYASPEHSNSIFAARNLVAGPPPTAVMQNAVGGSLAVTRDAFFALGGFDEGFVGWGGEDNEFWERAETREVYAYGYLPLVHLWHPPQPGKLKRMPPSEHARYFRAAGVPPAERIRRLTNVSFGSLSGPRRTETWAPSGGETAS